MKLRRIRRGGTYFRVADPDWDDPLDTSFARERGGRWNAPGTFPVLYLNASEEVARAQVVVRYRDRPYRVEDLDPGEAPRLVDVDVQGTAFVDAVTDAGCASAGLPQTYPFENGTVITYERCRAIGREAWRQELPGIACRSAALPAGRQGEELAWFDRGVRPRLLRSRPFADWY